MSHKIDSDQSHLTHQISPNHIQPSWDLKKVATVSFVALLIIGTMLIPVAGALILKPEGSSVCDGDQCQQEGSNCQRIQQLNADNNYLPTPDEYCVGESCPPNLIDCHHLEVIDFSLRQNELRSITHDTIVNAESTLETPFWGSFASYFSGNDANIIKLQQEKEELSCVGRELDQIVSRLHGDYYDYYASNEDWSMRIPRGYYAGKEARDLHTYELTPALQKVCIRLFDLCVRAIHDSWDAAARIKWLGCAIEQVEFLLCGGHQRALSIFCPHRVSNSKARKMMEKAISYSEELAMLDPDNAEDFHEKTKDYQKRLERLEKYSV